MAGSADDDVVVYGDSQPLARLRDRAGDLDVRATGGGVAAGMVVDEDDRGRAEIDRAADHLADIDRGLVDRALAHHLVADQHVTCVKIKTLLLKRM